MEGINHIRANQTTNMLKKPNKPIMPKVKVQEIVDSVKFEIYLNDFETFEKRLHQIKAIFDNYQLPNFREEFPFLYIWPLRLFTNLALKIFRKIYFYSSQNQREAFNQLIGEIKVLYVSLRNIRNETGLDKKESDGKKN